MNDGGSWRGISSQCLRNGFGDGLGPSERLHVHRVDEEHIASWKKHTQGDVMGAGVGGDDPQVLSSGQSQAKAPEPRNVVCPPRDIWVWE